MPASEPQPDHARGARATPEEPCAPTAATAVAVDWRGAHRCPRGAIAAPAAVAEHGLGATAAAGIARPAGVAAERAKSGVAAKSSGGRRAAAAATASPTEVVWVEASQRICAGQTGGAASALTGVATAAASAAGAGGSSQSAKAPDDGSPAGQGAWSSTTACLGHRLRRLGATSFQAGQALSSRVAPDGIGIGKSCSDVLLLPPPPPAVALLPPPPPPPPLPRYQRWSIVMPAERDPACRPTVATGTAKPAPAPSRASVAVNTSITR